ncbi:unnamed protein product [Paramecium pentaurelia]|uniref:WD40-repeat-containing domain n=1 Tax=Paramecium pentaurelia TaxID=43138 RepID=A0A8S1XQI1_9CILI|nr:unnamed protein product [Paramecium pentaurelia]
MFLQCKEHAMPITQIETAKNAKQGSRAKCEKCTMSGTVVHVQIFEKFLNQKIQEAEKMKKDNLDEFGNLSNSLEKLLTNYKQEFNSTIELIYQEVRNIKQKIHENFSITKQPLESQSILEFEQICHKVYSDSFDKFHLKMQYSKLIELHQNLIKMQDYYSQKIKKCFKQLQKDMINYELQSIFNVPGHKVCTAMCTGQDSDYQFVVLALGNIMKTYEFCLEKKKEIEKQKAIEILKAVEKQSFKDFTHNIGSVVLSEDQTYLIAGGTYDNKMIIYKQICETKKMYESKKSLFFQEPIFSIIFTPNNEDLISASGNDIFCITNQNLQTILDQKQQQQQKNQNVINENIDQYKLEPSSHQNTVYQLSYQLNQSKQKLMSCGYDKQIFIWQKLNDEWCQIHKIRIKNSVYRCCFVDIDQIVVQENSSRDLTFYNNVSNKNLCTKDTTQQCKFNDLNTDLSHNFPMIYLENKKLLIVKHNSKIVFFRKRKNQLFYKEDEKDGEMGTVTNDGEIFLKWDKINSNVEIYEQNTKYQASKEEFDQKFFGSQSKIFQDSNLQSIKDQKSEYIGNTNLIEGNQQKEIKDQKPLQNNDILLELRQGNEYNVKNKNDQKPFLEMLKSGADDQKQEQSINKSGADDQKQEQSINTSGADYQKQEQSINTSGADYQKQEQSMKKSDLDDQKQQQSMKKSDTFDQKPILQLDKTDSPPHLVEFKD